jgi:4-alpha-glucanotransferase
MKIDMTSDETVRIVASLAQRYGISPTYRNARGKKVSARPETQIRLLSEMGVALEQLQNAPPALADVDGSFIPPVLVVVRSEDGICTIDLNLPEDVEKLNWSVTLEGGGERRGVSHGTRSPSQPLRLAIPDLPFGYHRLEVPATGDAGVLVVTPGRCWIPPAFDNGPGLWGISVQLYLMRSAQNWGIGDFADLKNLASMLAARGCDVIGLNPLHQMMLDDPESASPYSPLTRLYLNVLYIAVPEVVGAGLPALRDLVGSRDFQARLATCRAAPLVDYKLALALKLEALRVLYAEFPQAAAPDRSRFAAFCDSHSISLRRMSIFQSLRNHFAAQPSSSADWRSWPQEYQSPTSDAVEKFAREHSDEIEFYTWLQWVADKQLTEAARVATDAGMSIGLYRDLAVGCAYAGAETWANPAAFISGVQVGAPPDIFNPAGQNWGLPPFNPQALRKEGYRSFVELVRANMRHAGAIRIDHVMGLQRLYCIPHGCNAAEGAYIEYPLDDLTGIIALESHRHRCFVVGEDLGTAPDGFHEKMSQAGILSYRVAFFEQDWDSGEFTLPAEYPRVALAVAGNHDLPTLIGWWQARDLDLKDKRGLFPPGEAISQQKRRQLERTEFVKALNTEGLLDMEATPDQFVEAVHNFIARSGAAFVILQLDDLVGEHDQVNLPGTFLEYPNWRRKYAVTLDELDRNPLVWQRAGLVPKIRSSDNCQEVIDGSRR